MSAGRGQHQVALLLRQRGDVSARYAPPDESVERDGIGRELCGTNISLEPVTP
jgi:hypothetical protein